MLSYQQKFAEYSSIPQVLEYIKGYKTSKEKGNAFEAFASFFFSHDERVAPYVKNVYSYWEDSMIPESILQELKLPSKDKGIDLLCETYEGTYWAVQVKFRSKFTETIKWGEELATFESLFLRIQTQNPKLERGILFTSTYACPEQYNAHPYLSSFTHDDIIVSERFMPCLHQKIFSNSQPVISTPSKTPRPYQQRILDATWSYYEDNDRGKLILPCGAGKTLLSVWMIQEYIEKIISLSSSLVLESKPSLPLKINEERNSPSVCVMVVLPTLDLVGQYMHVFLTHYPYLNYSGLNFNDLSDHTRSSHRFFVGDDLAEKSTEIKYAPDETISVLQESASEICHLRDMPTSVLVPLVSDRGTDASLREVAETEDLLRWATLVVASEIGKYDQHYYTISTKEEEWQAFVDSNVELPKIVFATYASVPRFHSFCEKQKIQLDFVVVDEAHLSAGDTKKTIHPLIDPRQTITSKFLFMTATEKIVHEKDVLRSMNCMSDKNVYGAYIARIDFRSLYNEGMQLKTPYICDYQVHCVLDSLSDYNPQNYVLSKTAQKEPLAIIQSHLACLNILKDAFDQGQVTHVIAYCSRIKDATLMKQLAQNAQNAENRVFAKDIKIFAISGSQSPSQRKRILNEYSSASKAIIFNVRVLQCGVDLPITNGIAFCSDITSTIQIVQMIMRGSRLYPGKKDFKVIVPCLIDSDEDFLQEGKGSFTQVRRVLVALTEEDPDLKEEALCLYQAGEYPTKQRILHKVCKSLPEIDLEVWMVKFKTHALTSNRLYDLNWEYKYQLCVKYVEEHQQLPPRKTPIIGSWCNSQRIKYKRKHQALEIGAAHSAENIKEKS
jgi:predicted helicase